VTPIRIGYNKLWGLAMLAVAAIGVLVYLLTGAILQLGFGLVFGISAVLWLTRPFIVVTDGVIAVKNMMGIPLKKFRFEQLADLDVERDAILVGLKGDRTRLKVSTMIVSRSDLDQLAAAVREAKATRAAAAPAT
jgi:hypothetical protein